MKYLVELEWTGYSRGTSVYEVEADSKEEAERRWYNGKRVEHVIVRDDTEKENIFAKEAAE